MQEYAADGQAMTFIEEEQFAQQILCLCAASEVVVVWPAIHVNQIRVEFSLRPALWRSERVRVDLNCTVGFSKGGRLLAQEAPEATTQGPHITLACEVLADNLRSHRRKCSTPRLRLEHFSPLWRKHLRKAPIDDDGLRRIRGGEHHVVELQILVHHSFRVSICDTLAHLLKDTTGPSLRYWRHRTDLVDNCRQQRAMKQVCDKIQHFLVDVGLEDTKDGRVVQHLECFELSLDEGHRHPKCDRVTCIYCLHATQTIISPSTHAVTDSEDPLADSFDDFVVIKWLLTMLLDEKIMSQRHCLLSYLKGS
mmetsp:Transcript_45681/g.121153  ORF Transcript_45681/g.121153 Transcript_45681/m.121153 type:complete len:308 (-) Transcript_45681:190-1113(-)